MDISNTLQKLSQVIVLDDNRVSNNQSLYGTVPLLPLHTGFDSIVKLQRQLLAEGFKHTIIISDTVAEFENWKGIKPEQRPLVISYYMHMLKLLGLGSANIVLASSFQRKEYYWDLVFKLSEVITSRELLKASPQDERSLEKQTLKEPFHILFQIADIIAHNSSLVVGNVSQKRIYDVARKVLRKTGYQAPGELLVDLPKDILGNDLNSSRSATRISYHETQETLQKKIFAIPNENKQLIFDLFINSVYTYVPQVLISGNRYSEKQFIEQWPTIQEIDFAVLKNDLVAALWKRFGSYSEYFETNKKLIEWIDLDRVRGV